MSEVVREAMDEYLRVQRPVPLLRTADGRVVSDAEIQVLADEAERGYDVEDLTER